METIAKAGGVFALLVLIHFTIDWIFQSHDEAIRKSKEWKVRARHCLIYTAPFAIVLVWSSSQQYVSPSSASGLVVLVFLSHFIEDTYLPVVWWMKYVRRPPEMRWRITMNGKSPCIMVPEGYILAVPVSQVPSGQNWRIDLLNEVISKKKTIKEAQKELDHRGFIEFVSKPLGILLMIAVDQIIHLLFLIPVSIAIVY